MSSSRLKGLSQIAPSNLTIVFVNFSEDSPLLLKTSLADFGKQSQFIRVYSMKAYRTDRGVAPHLLNLGTGWSGQLYVPAL